METRPLLRRRILTTQDTWKITPRLTLDYGLCLSWYQPQYDSSDQASTFALLGNNSLPANFLRPLYGHNSVTVYESAATSNYNALQFALNRRASRGLFLGPTYTYSKALTTASSDTSSVRVDLFTHAYRRVQCVQSRQLHGLEHHSELQRLSDQQRHRHRSTDPGQQRHSIQRLGPVGERHRFRLGNLARRRRSRRTAGAAVARSLLVLTNGSCREGARGP